MTGHEALMNSFFSEGMMKRWVLMPSEIPSAKRRNADREAGTLLGRRFRKTEPVGFLNKTDGQWGFGKGVTGETKDQNWRSDEGDGAGLPSRPSGSFDEGFRRRCGDRHPVGDEQRIQSLGFAVIPETGAIGTDMGMRGVMEDAARISCRGHRAVKYRWKPG